MIENKRFTLEEFGLSFIVNDNGKNLTAKQTVEKLNQLYEEDELLKKSVKRQQNSNNECAKLIEEQQKENKQLKEERNYFERKKCEYFNKYNKKHLNNIQLKKENEELKQKIKSINEILTEDIGYIESLRKIEEVLK